jgi:hypothetical protein
MKTNNIVPSKKIALLSAAAFCAAMLAFSPNASALTILTIGDLNELGTLKPSEPAGNDQRTLYVNTMIGLGLGGSTHVIIGPHDNLVTRSNNDFGALPGPAVLALNGTGNTNIDLGDGTLYSYLLAKYDGPNGASEVWFVGGMAGLVDIPSFGFGPAGTTKYGLSGWTLFGPGVPGVPDGGTTVMLLGAALGALGMARRFLKS